MFKRGIRLSLLLALVHTAHAGGDTADRWQEHAFGISLQPPVGTRLYERIGHDAIPWTLGGGGRVALLDLGAKMQLAPIRAELQRHHDHESKKLLEAIANRHVIAPERQAHFLSHTNDDAVLLMRSDIDYMINLYLRSTDKDIDLSQIVDGANRRIFDKWPSALITDERKLEVAGHAAALMYYRLPKSSRDASARGLLFIPLHAKAFAMLQLDVPWVMLEDIRPIYEAVINSIAIRDPAGVYDQRQQQLARGELWVRQLDGKRFRAAMLDEQLMRVVQGQRDIGYIKIRMTAAEKLQMPGIEVQVRARIYEDAHLRDTESRFFLSDDRTHELWSINTTARRRGGPKKASTTVTWAETGVRSFDRVEVTRQNPAAPKKLRWQSPAGYASLVLLHLTGPILSGKSQDEMGLYAYLPTEGRIAYRTVHVQPTTNGHQVLIRPSPEQGLTVEAYDRDGKLQVRRMPGGRWMIPTHNAQLETLWRGVE